MKVIVTGANGKIADALAVLPFDFILTDIHAELAENAFRKVKHTYYSGNLSEPDFCRFIAQQATVLIHLAGSSNPFSAWEDIWSNNIQMVKQLFETCVSEGTEHIIFGSSNRVVGGYEQEHQHFFHSKALKKESEKITELHPPRPFQYYGLSKLFGEQLGRYLSDFSGIRFTALRIGSVLDAQNDHPYAYAEEAVNKGEAVRFDANYEKLVNRLKSTWLSRRDFAALVQCAVNHTGKYQVYNAISENDRAWLSILKAKQELNFQPADNAENRKNPYQQ